MKKSYKLFGTFWDGLETLDTPIAEFHGTEQIRDYREEYDLFDTGEFVRSVKISDLLRLDTGEKIFSILKKLRNCTKVVIILDTRINHPNPVIKRFLSKRIFQCLRFVKDHIENRATKIFIDLPGNTHNLLSLGK